MQTVQQHWETVFTNKASDEVSWFQPYPATSMAFLASFQLPLTANIIDIGGGDSRLVDALLEKGYQNIYVLDISATALEKAKQRLGSKANNVHWIVSDVLDYKPTVQFDFWHDRAAFHFLTSEDKIKSYVQLAGQSIKPGGYFVLGTFSENGPAKCSGLEIKQYTAAAMSATFDAQFKRIRCITEEHETPSHNIQNFVFCSFTHR